MTSFPPSGEANAFSYASGVTETVGRNARGQITSIEAKIGASNVLLSLSNEYEAAMNNGNLKSQTMQPLGRKQSFPYDAKNRLDSAQETPAGGGAASWSQTFGYDDFGNRWVSAFAGTLPGGGPRPNGPAWYQAVPAGGGAAVISNRVTGLAYDAAGNQLGIGGMTGLFDGENRLKGVSGAFTYDYDAFGQRVRTVANGKTTHFVYDALGRLTAEYEPGQTPTLQKRYVVQDQLGSTRLVTNAAGGVMLRSDYLPYGEEIPSSVGGRTLLGYGSDAGVKQGFTGKERDGETGLDSFGARHYSGALGRFLSADLPLYDQDAGDPLSWNLFSYVRNNPLRYIDPTGRGCVSTQSGHSSTGIPLWTNTSDPRVPGPSCGEIDRQDAQGTPSVRVHDFAPPGPLLLAVAQGAQRAAPGVNLVGHGLVAMGAIAAGAGTGVAQSALGLGGNIGARLLPLGMTTGYFGQQVMRWGTGHAQALARAGTVTLQEMQSAGITRQMAQSWQQFYSYVAQMNPANPSAAGRAQLMQHVVELFDKGK